MSMQAASHVVNLPTVPTQTKTEPNKDRSLNYAVTFAAVGVLLSLLSIVLTGLTLAE